MKTKESGLPTAALRELRALYKREKGFLTPEVVLAQAQSPKSALHSRFIWDDTEAAQRYRLEQARGLIRSVRVHLIRTNAPPIQVRAFVSLPSDRETGVGYRHITQVMRSASQRDELLREALAELNAFRKKYADLTELSAVFAEADKLAKRFKPKKK